MWTALQRLATTDVAGASQASDYRPELDGLRAVAVLAVLIHHLDPRWLPGGYVGVDVFFVISGYLITRLIVRQHARGEFRFVQFFARRFRRLAPAMLVTLLTTVTASALLMTDEDRDRAAASATAHLVLLSNHYFAAETGYFAPEAEQTPLLHFWSLAVEEQFYIFYPSLLIVLLGRGTRITVAGIVAGALASLFISIWYTARAPAAAYFLIPTRAWELAVGAFVAFAPPVGERHTKRRIPFAAAGLVAILSACVFFGPDTPFPSWKAVLPVAGAAAFILGNARGNTTAPEEGKPPFVGRLLSNRCVVFIGLISYSLYLTHWPLVALANYIAIEEPDAAAKLRLGALSLLSAYLLWALVEEPVRRRRVLASRRSLLIASAGMVVALSSTPIILGLAGRSPRMDTVAIDAPDRLERLEALDRDGVRDADLHALGQHFDGTADLVLWGDSHARVLLPALDQGLRTRGLSGFAIAGNGRPPVLGVYRPQGGEIEYAEPGRMDTWSRSSLSAILNGKPRRVLLAANWVGYVEPGPGEVAALPTSFAGSTSAGGKSPEPGVPVLTEALRQIVSRLQSTGIDVWLMRTVPLQRDNKVARIGTLSRHNGINPSDYAVSVEEALSRRASLDSTFSEQANVHVLDPLPYLSNNAGQTVVFWRGRETYSDQGHLSQHGVRLLEPMFEKSGIFEFEPTAGTPLNE